MWLDKNQYSTSIFTGKTSEGKYCRRLAERERNKRRNKQISYIFLGRKSHDLISRVSNDDLTTRTLIFADKEICYFLDLLQNKFPWIKVKTSSSITCKHENWEGAGRIWKFMWIPQTTGDGLHKYFHVVLFHFADGLFEKVAFGETNLCIHSVHFTNGTECLEYHSIYSEVVPKKRALDFGRHLNQNRIELTALWLFGKCICDQPVNSVFSCQYFYGWGKRMINNKHPAYNADTR